METTQECCVVFWKDPGIITLQNSSCTVIYFLSRKLSKEGKKHMLGTTEKLKTKSMVTFSNRLLHMDIPVLAEW